MLYTKRFFAMACANFCVLSSFGTFFLFPLFITQHEGDQVDVGLLMGAFALSCVLCRPWVSEMVDRLGRKRSYTLGSFVMTALPLTYLCFQGSIADTRTPILLIRILHGIGFAICITAAFTYVADLIPPGRLNEGIGIFGVSGLTGSAVGPVVAESVIGRYGFSTLFILAAGAALVAFLIHLPLPDTYRPIPGARRHASFFGMLRQKRILSVALLAYLFGFGLAASNNFVTPYASALNIPFISLYYIAYSTAAVLTRLFGARVADRFGEERMLPYALALTGIGLLAMIFLHGRLVLALSGFLTGSGHGMLYPSLNALALRGEAAQVRGKITGVFTGSIDAGAFIGSVLLGYIGKFVGFGPLFFAAGMALMVGLLLFKFQIMRNGNGSLRLPPAEAPD